MIQKGTQLIITDKSGVRTVNVFHIYQGFKHLQAKPGQFLYVSIRHIKPSCTLKKGKKSKAFFVRSKFKYLKKDGSYIRAFFNAGILLKKRMNVRGKELKGPIFYGVKRKRFITSFVARV